MSFQISNDFQSTPSTSVFRLENVNLCNARTIAFTGINGLRVIESTPEERAADAARLAQEEARLAAALGNDAVRFLRDQIGMRIENDGRVIINAPNSKRVTTLPSGAIEIAPAAAASGR